MVQLLFESANQSSTSRYKSLLCVAAPFSSPTGHAATTGVLPVLNIIAALGAVSLLSTDTSDGARVRDARGGLSLGQTHGRGLCAFRGCDWASARRRSHRWNNFTGAKREPILAILANNFFTEPVKFVYRLDDWSWSIVCNQINLFLAPAWTPPTHIDTSFPVGPSGCGRGRRKWMQVSRT